MDLNALPWAIGKCSAGEIVDDLDMVTFVKDTVCSTIREYKAIEFVKAANTPAHDLNCPANTIEV